MHFVKEIVIFQSQRIIVFTSKDRYAPDQNQSKSGDKHYFAVQSKFEDTSEFGSFDVFQHADYIPPHDVSQTTKNNKQTGDDVDKRVGRIVAQTVFCYDIYASVAKGRNRIKN